jgi:hypothetical protein
MTLYHLGRTLQFAGMVLLPVGLSIGLFANDVRTEVKLLFIGGFLFLLGRILTRKNS